MFLFYLFPLILSRFLPRSNKTSWILNLSYTPSKVIGLSHLYICLDSTFLSYFLALLGFKFYENGILLYIVFWNVLFSLQHSASKIWTFFTFICNSVIFTAIFKIHCVTITFNFSIFLLARNLGCVQIFFFFFEDYKMHYGYSLVYLKRELLSWRVCNCSVLQDDAKLFSKEVVPVYSPTSSILEFPLTYFLLNCS